MSKTSEVLFSPLFKDNPIALQVLGICSALAVTSKLYPTLIMCVALTAIITLSSFFISLIRNSRSEESRERSQGQRHVKFKEYKKKITSFMSLVEIVFSMKEVFQTLPYTVYPTL